MAAHRIGGLAVALGIGSAVMVGHGVASAEPSDGSSGSESASSSTSAGESSTTTDSTDASTESTDSAESSTPSSPSSTESSESEDSETTTTPDDSDVDGTEADAKVDDDAPTAKKRSNRLRQAEKAEKAAESDTSKPEAQTSSGGERTTTQPTTTEPTAETAEATTDAASEPAADDSTVTVEVVSAPTTEPEATTVTEPETVTESEPAEPSKPQDPVDVATVALSKAVSALFKPFAGDAPTAPLASPAMWTLAAAARRELVEPSPSLELAADPVTNSLTTLAVADEPTVVAIEQVAPLAFLQQVPIVGPLVFTPIVEVIHQIPVVGDVLHQFVGYPVQWGLPANAPRPRDVKVISEDGTAIYVHFMPARGLAPGVKAPTVLNGPGLGMPGATNINGTFLDPILADTVGMMSVGTLRNAGYNVVTWDPRGEWKSGGRLELNAAEFEGKDMSAIISWVATQPEVRLDAPGDPRIGMVGVSYGGGIQLVTAANDTRVDAIVPAITYNGLDSSLYKNQAFKSSWATPLTAVLALTGARINPRILPSTVYGDLTGTLTQEDLDLLISRNPDISKITVPTLLIQGTVDTIFSLQEADETAQILLANGVTTKVVWFCGGHGVCANNLLDLRDGALIQRRTLEWLDRYVKGDVTVDTGPQFEWVDQRGRWYSSDTYPVGQGPVVAAGSSGGSLPLIPYVGGSGIPFVPLAFKAPHALNLRIPEATDTTYLVGAPELTLTYSGTGSSRHVYAQLVDDNTGLVLGSIVTPIPVTLDGDTHTVTVSLEPVAHTLRPGETVTLQLVATAGMYEKINPSLGVLNVSSMQLTVPTANPAEVASPSVVQVVQVTTAA